MRHAVQVALGYVHEAKKSSGVKDSEAAYKAIVAALKKKGVKFDDDVTDKGMWIEITDMPQDEASSLLDDIISDLPSDQRFWVDHDNGEPSLHVNDGGGRGR